jgi:hypothetical protein
MTTATAQDIDPARLARLERAADRQEILDCLIRFSRGIDRFDRALLLSAFHPDAIDDHGEFVGTPEQLYDFATGLHGLGQHCTHHNLLNHSCEIDGDTAHSETYYLFTGRNRDDATIWIAQGRYLDRLERRGGEWKIAMRYCVVEWAGVLPATNIPFADVPDVHANGVPQRGLEDVSYLRPLTNSRPMRYPADLAALSGPRS